MKVSKQQALYVDFHRGKKCQTCDNYRKLSCSKVQGPISPDGYCSKFYEPKAEK